MTRQMPLALPPQEAWARTDFIVSPSNAVAFAMIDSWPAGWPARKLALTGPEGAGKTHLARIWAEEAGAQRLMARDLRGADVPALSHRNIVIEDVPGIAGDRAAEEALFHLHNLVLAEGHALLVTGRKPVAAWGLTLPDLASRMQAAPAAILDAPDDALLAQLLEKLFADRRMPHTGDVIPYLLRWMERSFAAAVQVANALDRASIAERRQVTRPMTVRILGDLQGRSGPVSA